jgi:hypothetical protein|uniref:Uncharacterized protein n=1 Tax=Klebsiella pneumoniae TaxID=573 RepID=A0A2P1BP17_KLEPN|nr:hypothetical protein [Klebsiella pneumoniae]
MLVKSISKSKVKGLNNRMQILRCYIKKGNDFNERYNKELNGQVNNPLSNTTEEFRKKAEESARKMDGKLP